MLCRFIKDLSSDLWTELWSSQVYIVQTFKQIWITRIVLKCYQGFWLLAKC